MKIGYYIDSYLCCGGNRIIFEHCNRLAEKGHKMIVVCRRPELHEKDWFDFDISINHINPKEYPDDMDILVATYWSTLYDIILERFKAKQIFYFVQSDERRFVKEEVSKHYVNNTYKANVNIITIARWIRNWLLTEFNKKSVIIENKLNKKHFYPDPSIKTDKITVLLEGNLDVEYKGIMDGMQALDDLDVDKWLVTNSSKENIKDIHKEFFDKIWIKPNQDKLRQIFSSADILMKVSWFEGSPLVQMEAMACGTTLVTTEATGTEENCIHEYNCLKLPVKNILAIREAVRRLIEDKELREKLASNGLKYSEKYFDWSKSIDKLEKVFKDSLDNPVVKSK